MKPPDWQRWCEERPVLTGRPRITCLCGSTRFMQTFHDVGWALTLQGNIVLSVGVCKHARDHWGEALGQAIVDALDALHLRKIDLADDVWCLNVGGYIGESTAREIAYAMLHGKTLHWLEPARKQEALVKVKAAGLFEEPSHEN